MLKTAFAAIPPMFKRSFFYAALAAAASATPASAMEFARHALPELAPNAIGLSLFGEINPGDGERFRQFIGQLSTTDRIMLVALNSGGGSIDEALYIARKIHQSGATTMVYDRSVCASACFLMFAAAEQRVVGAAGQVGVHSLSVNGAEDQSTKADTTELARQVKAAGVPDAVIGKMVATPPGQIAWLDTADLAAMNVKLIPSPPLAALSTAPAPGPQPPTAILPSTAPIPPSRPAPAPTDPTQAFELGQTERREAWIAAIREGSQFKEGAIYWASVRSTKKAAIGCVGPGYTGTAEEKEWAAGCLNAKAKLDPTDYRRLTNAHYRDGWNSVPDTENDVQPRAGPVTYRAVGQ